MKKNFLLALIGIGVCGIGFGLITPVTIILMEQNHVPTFITGSSTMVGYLSVILFSGYTGKLIDRWNVKIILQTGLLLWIISGLGHMFWHIYLILYSVKVLMGLGGTLTFVSTEVIVNYCSNDTNRGKNIGLYAVVLSLGIAIGSLLIWTKKLGDWVPFVIGSSIVFCVLIVQITFFEKMELYAPERKPEKMPFRRMPFIGILSSLIYGFFESSVLVALPLYGLRNYFTADQVSYFISSYVIGGIVLLYFIGFVADKTSKIKLLLIISAILGILFSIPLFTLAFGLLIAVLFLIGGSVPAFYTLGLNYTIDRVEKRYMAQANGYFIMVYGIGTVLGPLAASLLVDWNKHYGFWSFSSLLCLVFFITTGMWRRENRGV
jgi:MFS family permease